MKLATATAFVSLLIRAPLSIVAHTDEDNSSSLSSRPHSHMSTTQNETFSSTSNIRRFLLSPAASQGTGKVMAMGDFGKIDVSSVNAAQAGAKGILETHGVAAPSIEYESTNNNVHHVRLVQKIHGMTVEGASIVVHSDTDGNVFAINGELVDDSTMPSAEPTIDAATAITAALVQSRVPAKFHDQCSEPALTIVFGINDGLAHLAWTCTVRYDVRSEDGYDKPYKDQIFAHANGEPGLIQLHPMIYNALSLETRNCNGSKRKCPVVSTSPNDIDIGDVAINSAHNFAKDVYEYYNSKFGRDSIDGNGMTIISRVHYGKKYNNAFWDGVQMTYGDGDGVTCLPFSQALDVVAHELTHGVTERSSNLIYENESGALNEALSDIFGALVEQSAGFSTSEIWLSGEAIYTPNTPGDAIRYMCNPTVDGISSDYYPERYLGTEDNGGVHLNSGIANLAACLMVKGGTHPRGKSSVTVAPLGGGTAYSQAAYDAVAKAFYFANTNCLTSSSGFAAMKWCTADVHKPDIAADSAKIAAAWEAVGILGLSSSSPSTPPPSPPVSSSKSGKRLG